MARRSKRAAGRVLFVIKINYKEELPVPINILLSTYNVPFKITPTVRHFAASHSLDGSLD
jgi:hypothetical protein